MKYYLDTNIFLRLYLDDNPEQTKELKFFINDAIKQSDKLFVTIEILLEFEYVLRKFYKQHKNITIKYLRSIITTSYLTLIDDGEIRLACQLFEHCNVDLVDCVLFSRSVLDNAEIKSFDKDFIKIKKVYDILS